MKLTLTVNPLVIAFLFLIMAGAIPAMAFYAPATEPDHVVNETEIVWRADIPRTSGTDPREHPYWGGIVPTDYIGTRVAQAPDGSIYLLCSNYIQSETGRSHDIVLVKYDRDGGREWYREIASEATDVGFCIQSDAEGNVYIAGVVGQPESQNRMMHHAFVASYTPSGRRRWVHIEDSFVSASDNRKPGSAFYLDMAIEEDSLCLTGYIIGRIDRREETYSSQSRLLVSRFRLDGRKHWSRQYAGSRQDAQVLSLAGTGIAVRDGRLYVVGIETLRAHNAENDDDQHSDSFALCLDGSGDVGWRRSFGVAPNPRRAGREGRRGQHESAMSVAIDSTGHLYIAGFSNGDLTGEPRPEDWRFPGHPYLTKYSPEGNQVWVRQPMFPYNQFVIYDLHIDTQDRIWSVGAASPTHTVIDQLVVMRQDTEGTIESMLCTELDTHHAGGAITYDENQDHLVVAGHCLLALEGITNQDDGDTSLPHSFVMRIPPLAPQ